MRKVGMSEKGLRVLRAQAEKRKNERSLGPEEFKEVAEALRESYDRLAEAEAKGEG